MLFPTIMIDSAPTFPLLKLLGYALFQRKLEKTEQKTSEKEAPEQEDHE